MAKFRQSFVHDPLTTFGTENMFIRDFSQANALEFIENLE